jgi:hydrogenase maturation protease
MQGPPGVVILGIGNVLWADEGFGVRAIEHLHQHWELPEQVRLVEGGTQGIYLLEHVQAASILVILDAIDYGLEPGTLKLIEDDAVPSYLGAKKVSLHQTGFQEVLATAAMLDSLPERLLVGVQPKDIEDFGGSLHPLLRSRLDPAVDAALAWLEQFGIEARRRQAPLGSSELLGGTEIDLERYEDERPDAVTACRVGDDRVLASDRYRVTYRPQALEPGAVTVDVDPRVKN